MAEQKIKFKVSIKELSFEFEGTREVGQALHTGLNRSLAQLLDTPRTAMANPANPAALLIDASQGEQSQTNGQIAEKPTKKSRRSGANQKELVRDLKTEAYFKEARTMANIIDRLKLKGHNVRSSSLSGRLQEMAKDKELFREQTDDGYVYKDIPFNESPRAENAPLEPAE